MWIESGQGGIYILQTTNVKVAHFVGHAFPEFEEVEPAEAEWFGWKVGCVGEALLDAGCRVALEIPRLRFDFEAASQWRQDSVRTELRSTSTWVRVESADVIVATLSILRVQSRILQIHVHARHSTQNIFHGTFKK